MSNIVLPSSDEEQLHDRPGIERNPIGLIVAIAAVILAWAAWPQAESASGEQTLSVPEPFSPPFGEWVETSFPDLDGGFTAVARRDGLVAAVGSGLRVDSPPFAYWSTDGEEWSRASGPWERGDLIVDILSHERGFLAVGHAFDPDTLEGAGLRLWASDDGTSWERVSPEGVEPGSVMTEIEHADGRFMAIGYEGPAAIDPGFQVATSHPGRVWTSADGITWAENTQLDAGGWFGSLIATSDGEFAIGGLLLQQPTIWRSGQEWSSASNSLAEYANLAVTELTEHSGRLIAMSQFESPEGPVFLWAVDADGDWIGLFGGTQRPQSTRWISVIDDDLYAGPPFSRAVFTTGPELWVSDTGRDWFGVEVTRGVSPWPPAAVSTTVEWNGGLFSFGSRGGVPTIWTLEG